MFRSVLRVLLSVLAVCLLPARGAAEPVRARITGVPAVNLRAQPTTRSRAVTWLNEGEPVKVERVDGDWALVNTAHADRGYLRVDYLDLREEDVQRLTAGADRQPRTGPATHSTPVRTANSPAAAVEGDSEIGALRTALEDLRRRATAGAGDSTGRALREIRDEIRQLSNRVRAVEVKVAPSPGRSADSLSSTPLFSWAMLALGGLLGGLVGVAYGRHQERGRRTRIRI